jgi:hypothetical protein
VIHRTGCAALGWEEGQRIGCDWISRCVPDKIRCFIRPLFDNLLAGDLSRVGSLIVTKAGAERLIGCGMM